MAKTFLNYDEMLLEALRGVIREVLTQVAERGILGNHHFFISFRTDHPGVDVPPYLRSEYPEEMTIVLQHQFSGLEISDEAFSVTLSFNKVPAHLTVPFAALTRFADPPANFGLQLTSAAATGEAAVSAQKKLAAAAETARASDTKTVDSASANGDGTSGKVIALDSFRKS
jgi:hypothetical protein